MAAGAWVITDNAKTSILDTSLGNIETATFKMALLLSTSNISTSSTTFTGVTNQVANGNGYTTGGETIALSLSGTGTVKCDIDTDPTWTASGAGITARYACIYATVSDEVLCYCELDSTPADVTVTAGNTLTVAANATNGVFELT